MISGILTVLSFLLCSAKFITRRIADAKTDHMLMQIHKPASLALIIFAVMHAWSLWKLRMQQPLGAALALIVLLGVFLLVLSHVCTRRWGSRWLQVHQAATLLIFLCMILQAVTGSLF